MAGNRRLNAIATTGTCADDPLRFFMVSWCHGHGRVDAARWGVDLAMVILPSLLFDHGEPKPVLSGVSKWQSA